MICWSCEKALGPPQVITIVVHDKEAVTAADFCSAECVMDWLAKVFALTMEEKE